MNKVLCDEELTSEERQAFIQILKSNPEIANSFAGWEEARAYLRSRIPDSRDLVLYSLVTKGHVEDLSDEEASEVSGKWKSLDSVVEAHPGFSEVTSQINQDREDFLACWEEEAGLSIIRFPSWSYRMAAVFAVLSVCILLVIFLLNQRDRALQVAVATPGDYERVLLPDSSVAHLSGPATLRFDEENFGRAVELTGEAFFDVTHGQDQFTVQTGEAVTRVLGTRFGVRSLNNITQVVLESGRVQVASIAENSQSVQLLPGQMTKIPQGSVAPTPPVAVDIEEELQWTGFLFFQNTSIRKAAVLISSIRNVRVEFEHSLINETVTGTFSPDTAIEEVMDALALALGAEVTKDGNTFRISASP
ncbi:MAG: FecR domain-containing protein [Bacteroidetes bacterium]|nr:FecR domain-containing protein [Bacteroidota bacterium]MCY4205826.1 FecR domain-containing protein [Bacteroidota bacterium]